MGLSFQGMPGFGDLPGDSRHPNSPDYVEPAYGEDDAEGDVAIVLAEADEVGALVSDVRGALAALQWACKQTNVPRHLQASLRVLTAKSSLLDRMVDAQRELMGRAA